MAYQSEIEKLEQRFKEKPEQWFAAVADAYRKSGEIDRALEVLDAWIDKRPNYTSGHIVRARCFMDQGAEPEASQAFQRVLELDPENIIAIKSLAEIAEGQGERDVARQWVERLLEVDPMNEEGQAALERLSEPAPEPAAETAPQTAEEAPAADAEAAEVSGFEPTAVEGEAAEEPASEVPLPSTVQETEVSFGDIALTEEPEPQVAEPVAEEPPAEPKAQVAEPTAEEPPAEPQPEAAEPTAEEPPAQPEPALAATVQEPAVDVDAAGPDETIEQPPAGDELPIERASEAGAEATIEVEPMQVGAEGAEGAEAAGAAEEAKGPEGPVDLEFSIEGAEEPAAPEAAEPAPEAAAAPDAEPEGAEEPEEFAVDGLESVGGLEAGAEAEAEAEAETAAEELGATSFDEELAWDAGERTSRAISQEDIEEAEKAHEDALDVPAHALPGIEQEEVPEVGAAKADVTPTEGLMGVDTVPGGAAETTEQEAEATAEQPAAAEAGEAETALPLIMPEEVAPEGGGEQPEPVVTETMADLYVKQGHYREAQAIYEQLLSENPGDTRLQQRLDEVKARVRPATPAPPAKSARYSVAVTGGKSARSMFEELAGVQPAEPAAPAPAAAPEPTPDAPAPAPAPAAPAEPAGATPEQPTKGSGFSFDEFFGGQGESGASTPPAQSAPQAPPSGGAQPKPDSSPSSAEGKGDDDDFRDWLQKLKT